ncbi:MAG: hypothetical protein EVA88_03500 [Rhodospirillaceae bacterium]|nr:MAG: hypothetical protein EVA88_03500 [Rhodospirillaceae bacterium]
MNTTNDHIFEGLKTNLIQSVDALVHHLDAPWRTDRCTVDDGEFLEDQSERLNDLATRIAHAHRNQWISQAQVLKKS